MNKFRWKKKYNRYILGFFIIYCMIYRVFGNSENLNIQGMFAVFGLFQIPFVLFAVFNEWIGKGV